MNSVQGKGPQRGEAEAEADGEGEGGGGGGGASVCYALEATYAQTLFKL